MGKNKSRNIRKKSKYLGSIITPENRLQYISEQKKAYISRYSPKEGEEPLTDEELEDKAYKFAKHMAQKSQLELKAYLKGQTTFKHKGAILPVMTDDFIRNTHSLKEILKLDEEE